MSDFYQKNKGIINKLSYSMSAQLKRALPDINKAYLSIVTDSQKSGMTDSYNNCLQIKDFCIDYPNIIKYTPKIRTSGDISCVFEDSKRYVFGVDLTKLHIDWVEGYRMSLPVPIK